MRVAEPALEPVKTGKLLGVLIPAGITMLAGLTEHMLALLLLMEIVTPPAGAGDDKVIVIPIQPF